ncbi:hypothetical protein IIA15_01955 [candidate division TA06 bacterium]|nr:hypothetical protein [candidate division TA06 bacterium]
MAIKRDVTEIRAILKSKDVSIVEKQVGRYLKLLDYFRETFSRNEEAAICIYLLEEWKKNTEEVAIYLSDSKEIRSFPAVFTFGVLSGDWPGMSDSCIGIVHERKWNIYFVKSFVLKYEEKELGIVLITLNIDSKKEWKRLQREMDEIVEGLQRTYLGRDVKSDLLQRETRKLMAYPRVLEKITHLWKGNHLENLIGTKGEAFRFFASRSEAYITERSPHDLAMQIITNFEFQKKVREFGGRAQVKVENLKTTKENLTGITLAGFDRDFTLDDCLSGIHQVVPSFKRKYNKEFTTSDGITVYRLEITDGRDRFFPMRIGKRIEKGLFKMATGKGVERMRRIESIGGFEHYARAIIPYLVREQQTSRQPQVFISVVRTGEDVIEFKVIMVTRKSREKVTLLCVEELEKVRGLSVFSTNPPKILGEAEINILDVRVELTEYESYEEIYSRIKKCLHKIIGDFRDFDEGMRILDMKKLQEVREHLSEQEENLVRGLYYSLEDFYRMSAPVEDLVEHIQLGMETLQAFESASQTEGRAGRTGSAGGLRSKTIISGRNLVMNLAPDKQVPTATLVAIAHSKRRKSFSQWMEIFKGFEVTMSRLERGDQILLLFRLLEKGNPLSQIHLKNLLDVLKTKTQGVVLNSQ